MPIGIMGRTSGIVAYAFVRQPFSKQLYLDNYFPIGGSQWSGGLYGLGLVLFLAIVWPRVGLFSLRLTEISKLRSDE